MPQRQEGQPLLSLYRYIRDYARAHELCTRTSNARAHEPRLPLLLPLRGASDVTARNPGCRFATLACPGLGAFAPPGRALNAWKNPKFPSGFSLNACLPYNQHPQLFFFKPDSPKTKFPRHFLCPPYSLHYLCARNALVAKLVDAPDLGSGGSGRVGSSPIRRTQKSSTALSERAVPCLFCAYFGGRRASRASEMRRAQRFGSALRSSA